jgi:hypothetical protein
LKQARESYYAEKIQSCGRDQKSMLKVTKHLLGETNEVLLPSHSSAKDLAQEFSDYFVNKIENIRTKIYETVVDSDELNMKHSNVEFSEFTLASEEEITKLISKSANKSCELDPIPTWLLKECLTELVPVITKIINSSLATAYVPKLFKNSHIKPLLKKPSFDPNTLKNYRPVSNLPFISKILEKVVNTRLEHHLTSNNLHEPNQSAYRKFHSTETALVKVQNDILQSLDQRNVTILVMLDLSAAFDTIDHETLLQRLETLYGITGRPLAWMTSYFTDRYQTVFIDGELSIPVRMTYSVPQGSVLGPKYYVMYTKPVGVICRKHGLDNHFYADDSQLYMQFKPINDISIAETITRVTTCINEIIRWMNNNMLKINPAKTELIVFTSDRNSRAVEDISVKVDQSEITQSPSVKNLGAFFDSRMNMEQHINHVSKSCCAQLRQIGRIRQYINVEATKSLVNSMVTSRLDYCNALLYGVPNCTLNKLQNIQNTAARIITRTSRYDHITPVLKDLHWLPMQYRVKYKILTHTFKALHDQSPIYIRDMLQIHKPTRNLRSAHQPITLTVSKSNQVRYGDRSFQSAAPVLWNSLPSKIRDCTTLQNFKRELKTHFFVQAYGC